MSERLSPSERALLDVLQHADTPDAAAQSRAKQRLFSHLGLVAGSVGASLGASSASANSAGSVLSHAAPTGIDAAPGAGTAMGAPGVAQGGAAANGVGAAKVAAGANVASKWGVFSGLAAKAGAVKLTVALSATLGTAGAAIWLKHSPSRVEQNITATAGTPRSEPSQKGPEEEAPALQVSPQRTSDQPVASALVAPSHVALPPVAMSPSHDSNAGVVASMMQGPTPASSTAYRDARRTTTTRSSVEDEAQLLTRAQGLVRSGSPGAAIGVLLEHEKRFPRGTLSLERQAMLAVARCLSGQTARGRAEAERFRRNHPSSPMVKRLESACKLTGQ